MHVVPLIPNLAMVHTHAEDDGSTWPKGCQAPQPETGSRFLKHIFGLAVKCATPISWSDLLVHTGFLLLAIWVSSFETAHHSTHLGRWRRGDVTGSVAELKTFLQDDREKCGKRKGEGGGEVYTGKDLSFLNEKCIVGGQGQHNSGHDSVWCVHVLQVSENSLSLLTPRNSCTESSRSQGLCTCRKYSCPRVTWPASSQKPSRASSVKSSQPVYLLHCAYHNQKLLPLSF